MKKNFNEKNKLPHIFKYLEFTKTNTSKKKSKQIMYLNACDKHQTDFYLFEKPDKNLIRLI